jgi:preprotein translocase subunit SecE
MRGILQFVKEAKAELMLVNWPNRDEIIRYTILVIVFSFAVAVFLGALDYLFSYLVEHFLLIS